MSVLPEAINTPRLELRRWSVDDVDALAEAIAESLEHLRPWMAWVPFEPMPREVRLSKIREWNAAWAAGGDAIIGAFHEGRVVGGCGLHRRAGPDTLEIGYWIHVAHSRRGYATEVARALTSAAFTVEGIERIEIHHDKANVASRGVPVALGYEFTGETPDDIAAPGEVGIDCGWVLTKDRWASRNATATAQSS